MNLKIDSQGFIKIENFKIIPTGFIILIYHESINLKKTKCD
jgi:hypothetical protein